MRKLLKDCLYILFVVTIMFFLSDQPSFSGTMKFVQLSDIHYSLMRNDTSYKLLSQTRPLLRDAISQINNEKNQDRIIKIAHKYFDKFKNRQYKTPTMVELK